jgi:alpha-galactosidase
VWAGPLSENKVALVLWNRSSSKATITASWSDIGLEPETIVDARNIWEVRYLYNSPYIVLYMIFLLF